MINYNAPLKAKQITSDTASSHTTLSDAKAILSNNKILMEIGFRTINDWLGAISIAI